MFFGKCNTAQTGLDFSSAEARPNTRPHTVPQPAAGCLSLPPTGCCATRAPPDLVLRLRRSPGGGGGQLDQCGAYGALDQFLGLVMPQSDYF